MWTNDDFRTIYSFLRDIRAALDEPKILAECTELLQRECEEASRALSRVADGVGSEK